MQSWRQRSRAVDLAVRIAEGFRKHRSGRNAALISHFGFLSIFPLLLVFTTVLGFVLHSASGLRKRIIGSAVNQLPIIGQQMKIDPLKLQGNAVVLILGILVSLWAGMKAFVAVHTALDDVAEIPLDERSGLLITRLRALLGMAYVGGAQIIGAILASIVGVTGVPVISKVLVLVGTAAINTVMLGLSYRWLRTGKPEWRTLRPGAIAGGIIFTLLQLLGVAVVGRQVAHATPVYGTFAAVIGLLYWLSLHAMVALGGAELNAALTADGPPHPPGCDGLAV
ncbi:MAG: rane protein [Ilumatobacteraceae bacterium]|nr:rane protein [Ilumatobacteraceae bacterium]